MEERQVEQGNDRKIWKKSKLNREQYGNYGRKES